MSDGEQNENEEKDNLQLGFLFGNVDEDNRVDAPYLDEVGAPPPWTRCDAM